MSCGCAKKYQITEPVIKGDMVQSIVNTQENNPYEALLHKNIDAILRLFNAMLPVTVIASENDINCLECCEKHLASASAYITESRTKVYRINRFLAIGQMVLAERHAEEYEKLQELIRHSRLLLQRNKETPNWTKILALLDEYKATDKER